MKIVSRSGRAVLDVVLFPKVLYFSIDMFDTLDLTMGLSTLIHLPCQKYQAMEGDLAHAELSNIILQSQKKSG